MKIDIKVGSVTNAQRGLSLIKSYGYKGVIRKTEKTDKTEGCGYILRVFTNSKEPLTILEQNGINAQEVVTDDLS